MNPLFIFSGPSGAGKSTIVSEAIKNIQKLYMNTFDKELMNKRIITTTTRKPRDGETHGLDYYFIPVDTFKEKLSNDEFIEFVEYLGNYYGVTKQELNDKLANGPAFAIVEVNGMKKIKKFYSNTVTIFIKSSFEDVKKQLDKRNDPEKIKKERIAAYQNEIKDEVLYDYVIENKFGQLEQSVLAVENIIQRYLPNKH